MNLIQDSLGNSDTSRLGAYEVSTAYSRNTGIDYCFRFITGLSRGIWMSFFDTEEAHAVMLAYAANGGGRAALKVTPTSLDL
jgi:hypothetical protein